MSHRDGISHINDSYGGQCLILLVFHSARDTGYGYRSYVVVKTWLDESYIGQCLIQGLRLGYE